MSYPSGGVPDVVGNTVLTATDVNKIIDALNALFPLGSYIALCQAATSTETLVGGIWLECNGAAVSRTTYADLNTLLSGLSYPFGNGDGSTTFNVPDFRSRSFVHHGTSSAPTATKTMGANDGVAIGSRTPKGSVSVSGTTGNESSHTHGAGSYQVVTPVNSNLTGGLTNATLGGSTIAVTGTSGSGSAHSHSFSGSGTVPGNYLVAGIIAIKAFA